MEVNVERLKELRRERVLSLRELEERSGVSYNTIWRIEDGRQGAHPRTVRKLAEALGVDPSELIKEGYAWASAATARAASPGARVAAGEPSTRCTPRKGASAGRYTARPARRSRRNYRRLSLTG